MQKAGTEMQCIIKNLKVDMELPEQIVPESTGYRYVLFIAHSDKT